MCTCAWLLRTCRHVRVRAYAFHIHVNVPAWMDGFLSNARPRGDANIGKHEQFKHSVWKAKSWRERCCLLPLSLSQAHLLINRPRCSRQLWALIAGYFPIWNKCSFSIWWICTAYCHNLSDIMLYCFNATGNSWEWVIYRTHLASLALGSWLEKCNTSVITVTHSCNAVMALTSQQAVIGSSTYYFFSADGQNLQFVFKTYWRFFFFFFVKLLFSMLNLFGRDPNAVSDEVLHPRNVKHFDCF